MASWFRSWHGAPTDTKWLVISRRSGVSAGIVSAVYWALLDHASQADDRGSVAGFDVETYCEFAGFPEDRVIAILDALRDKNVIGPDDRLTTWDKRQPKREDDSSDRVRNWRAEHAKPVTPQPEQLVTHGNAMKHSVTHGNNTDTDTDTDTEQKQSRAEYLAPAAHDEDLTLEIDDNLTPEQRAIRNAYDACGITYSRTHEDAHLLAIRQVGLANWQRGWALAMEKGKHNLPAYVARCAESAMLAAQRGNGHGKQDAVPTTAEDRKRMYATEEMIHD